MSPITPRERALMIAGARVALARARDLHTQATMHGSVGQIMRASEMSCRAYEQMVELAGEAEAKQVWSPAEASQLLRALQAEG